MKRFLPILIAMMIFMSCQRVPDGENTDLYGSWTNRQHQDSLRIYSRISSLPDDAYGFTFAEGGVFYERKNIGWCGTPPISYGDYEGVWSIGDTLISIEVPYWGGTANYQWKLISVNEEELIIQEIFE